MKEKIENKPNEPQKFSFWKTFTYVFSVILVLLTIFFGFIGSYEEGFGEAFVGVIMFSFILALIPMLFIKWWRDYKSTGRLIAEDPIKIETEEDFVAFIVEQIKSGIDDTAIIQSLVEMGVDRNDARKLVQEIHRGAIEVAEQQQFTSEAILPVLIGAVLAAIISGFIWGWIVAATEYEIGFMALGVGAITGYAVVLFSKGKRGTPLQIIAVLASILGIIIGKYFIFLNILKEEVTKEYGAEVAANIPVISGDTIDFFFENLELLVSGFDIVWIILAVITAWGIPKGIGIKLSRYKSHCPNCGIKIKRSLGFCPRCGKKV